MQNKKPATVKVAMWSARHRWLVFGLWFVVIGVLVYVGLFQLGTKQKDNNGGPGQAQTESQKAAAVFKAAGSASYDSLLVVMSHPTLKVNDPAYETAVKDVIGQLKAVTYPANGVQKPVFTAINDYYSTKSPFLASPDGSTVRLTAQIDGTYEDAKDKFKYIKPVLDNIKSQYKDFTVYGYTHNSTNNDFWEVVNNDLEGSVYITIPSTFIILILAFGAIAAAVIPLILALTSLAATFSLMAIYSQVISPIDNSTPHVIILIGLAVGVDYSLFIVTRYRTERRKGRDKLAALEIASSTAGRAVFFSGLTVMISLAGLFLINDDTFTSIAIGTICVVLVSVIGSLTFLPATLSILGKGVNWGRVPYFGRDRAEGSGVWSHIVRVVMRRPAFFVVVTVGILVALAVPVLHLNMGDTTSSLEALPKQIEFRNAAILMQEKWPQGTSLTMQVVVKADAANRADVKAAMDRFSGAMLQTPGLSGPVATQVADNKQVVRLDFVMAGEADSQANRDLVNTVRQNIVPAYFNGLSGVEVYVTGETAYSLDLVNHYAAAAPLVFGFVLGLSFLLLLVAFHSIVIPIKAILLNLLSAGAAYGAVVLVFQDGWFGNLLGIEKIPVIESWLPLFLFTILFGLSMDYHLFVLTRIKEEKDRGATSSEAVARGIAVTSGTITSAAIIMVVVFAVFVTLRLVMIRQLGLGLAVAVFMDATIIRCILLPATMRLLGDWNWWMPKFLDWIPRVTIEGEPHTLAPALLTVEESEMAA